MIPASIPKPPFLPTSPSSATSHSIRMNTKSPKDMKSPRPGLQSSPRFGIASQQSGIASPINAKLSPQIHATPGSSVLSSSATMPLASTATSVHHDSAVTTNSNHSPQQLSGLKTTTNNQQRVFTFDGPPTTMASLQSPRNGGGGGGGSSSSNSNGSSGGGNNVLSPTVSPRFHARSSETNNLFSVSPILKSQLQHHHHPPVVTNHNNFDSAQGIENEKDIDLWNRYITLDEVLLTDIVQTTAIEEY